MINIRKALSKDTENIVIFLSARGLGEKDIYSKNDYYVYYDNDVLLGCGMSFAKDEYCIIENIIVHENYRRNKIGTSIAKTILNYYECNGAKYALGYGKCKEFCESLGFNLISQSQLPIYHQVSLSESNKVEPLYVVSLEGYFKGCN